MTLNIAHRGFSGMYPENTLLSFSKAIEIGADGAELDVHLSRDGELMVIHDENVRRTTGVEGLVKDMTFAELRALDASAAFVGKYGRNAIPTLREYFELIKDTDQITNIELKTGVYEYPGIEKKVLDLIDEYHRRDKVIISSFNHFSVLRFKKLAPDVKAGLLEESWILCAGAYTKAAGVECWHPFFNTLNADTLAELRAHGCEINSWTINSEADMRSALEMKLECAITNWPDRFGRIRREVCGA